MCYRFLMTTSLMMSLMSCCLLSGCDTPSEAASQAISTQELCELGAYISIAVVASGDDGGGDYTPKPGDICRDCNGTGKLGDGTVVFDCETCKGTGKIQPDGDAEDEFGSPESAEDWRKHWQEQMEPSQLIRKHGLLFREEMRNGRRVLIPMGKEQ